MTDLREQILCRLLAVAANIDGIENAYRNKPKIGEDFRPAIAIYDGDETTELQGDVKIAPVKPGYGPILVSMTPGIHILLGAEPENVGSNLNTLRAKFVGAVLTDATLAALTFASEGVRYGGCSTYFDLDKTVEADMMIMLSFVYVLDPLNL